MLSVKLQRTSRGIYLPLSCLGRIWKIVPFNYELLRRLLQRDVSCIVLDRLGSFWMRLCFWFRFSGTLPTCLLLFFLRVFLGSWDSFPKRMSSTLRDEIETRKKTNMESVLRWLSAADYRQYAPSLPMCRAVPLRRDRTLYFVFHIPCVTCRSTRPREISP